jgi:hypothetical protein
VLQEAAEVRPASITVAQAKHLAPGQGLEVKAKGGGIPRKHTTTTTTSTWHMVEC